MSDKLPPLRALSPRVLLLDAVLCLGAFAFLTWLIRGHVPSTDPRMIARWSVLAASCMTGVFWLCIQMARVVWLAQRERDRQPVPVRTR